MLDEDDVVLGQLKSGAARSILGIVEPHLAAKATREVWERIFKCQARPSQPRNEQPPPPPRDPRSSPFKTNTLYKRKGVKVNPVDNAPSDGSVPEGNAEWREERWAEAMKTLQPSTHLDEFFTPKFSTIASEDRLTPKRLEEVLDKTSDVLWPKEQELLGRVLRNRAAALAWDFNHLGKVHPSVVPPQKIRTIPHKAWQAPGIPIPRPLMPKVIELLKKRVENKVLEDGHGAYRNPWFLVKKKDGGLRLINNAQRYNAVTIRDAFIPPAADEVSEEFAMCQLLSLVDIFSGYDQVPLHPESRDLTTFATPIGLFRYCTLPQGATNSVAQFVRIVTRILRRLIPEVCRPFVDDICIKGPKSMYQDQLIRDGVRKAVVEHLQNVDAVLVECELAGMTVAVTKSQWCRKTANILGYICGSGGRLPDQTKVDKILSWERCHNVKDVRTFLGMVNVYRAWIARYSDFAGPLWKLLRKNQPFEWKDEQRSGFQSLQKALTSPPLLITIDYGWDGYENKADCQDHTHLSTGEDVQWLGNHGHSDQSAGEAIGPEEPEFSNGDSLVCKPKTEASPFAHYRFCQASALRVQPSLDKTTLISAYMKEGLIILQTDASLTGWGSVLMQVRGGKRLPARYESGIWKTGEAKYDATKRECRGVLCALKRLRFYLYGVRFLLETDALVLVQQLNGAMYDLPGALLTRWIAWIRTFDFAIRHIRGTQNAVADALSRRPVTAQDYKDREEDGDIEDFVDLQIHLNLISENGSPLDPGEAWSKESKDIARYVVDLVMPEGLSKQESQRFRNKCVKYYVHDQTLWYMPTKESHRRRVVDDPERRRDILETAHAEYGHRGRDATYGRIRQMYYWKGMHDQVEEAVNTCKECQMWSPRRYEERAQSTEPPAWIMWKIHLDIQHMPTDHGMRYLIEARCDLSGFVEAQPLRAANSKNIASFLETHLVHRYGLPGTVVVDGGTEFKGELKTTCEAMKISRVVTSAYNPRANGIVEGGHYTLASALAKTGKGQAKGWVKRLPVALFADRTTIRRSHGKTPFCIVYGYEPVVPLEIDTPTWRLIAWDPEMDSEEYLEARMRFLERRQNDLDAAAEKVASYRRKLADKRTITDRHRQRPESKTIREGDLVLVYNNLRKMDMSASVKLSYRWQGPYFVKEKAEKGVYKLITPDGIQLPGTFPPHRLKKFIRSDEFWVTEEEQEAEETDQSGTEEPSAPGEESSTEEYTEGSGEGEEGVRVSSPPKHKRVHFDIPIPDRYRPH